MSGSPSKVIKFEKRCTACREIKPLDQFPANGEYTHSYCISCKNEDARRAKYKYRYGIEYDIVEKMYQDQGGKCKTCGKEIALKGSKKENYKIAHLDHNHNTGKARALLCFQCNAIIGHCGELEDVLFRIILYLRDHA